MSSVDIVRYVIVPLAVALIGFGGYVVSKKAQKGSREDALISRLEARVNAQGKDIAGLKREMDELRSRELRLINYVHQLRQDIVDQRPPPPREWPEGLYQ